jgi:glucan 1,4-alpha-glucosidase
MERRKVSKAKIKSKKAKVKSLKLSRNTIKLMNKIFQKSQFCIMRLTSFTFVFLFLPCLCFAQTLAPGAPGKDAQWATAGKQGVGTSVTLESKVWFTLAQGVLTEVYYPDVTVANVHKLEFVVVDPKTRKVETEQADAIHEVKVLRPDSPTFQQINTAKSGAWKITKTYTTDTELNSILIAVKFEPKNKNLNLYVYYDPSLGNSGMHDSTGSNFGFEANQQSFLGPSQIFLAEDSKTKITSALKISNRLTEQTNTFLSDDIFDELKTKGKIEKTYWQAKNGNVVQLAKIDYPNKFEVVLSFGKDDVEAAQKAILSWKKGFAKCLEEYEKGWSDYVKTLRKVEPKYQAQFNMAAMQLKMLEDKTVRGANIASLTVPWGGDKNANENTVGGYHLVWSRDLYQVATAFIALGDKAAAERALDFLFKIQQKPDGSFPQNSFLDGKPFWGSLQLDEVAFPLILAYQLGKNDKTTWENHVKRAADFIVKNGPKTPQERWEEEGGYSPSTIAAEIAGLVCAAEIAQKNGDNASAQTYLKNADEWQANVEKWTVTTNGKYSKSPYYVRITDNGKPDAGEKIELNNGAGFFDEREIVDAGFLELVRLGVKSPNDPVIINSLKVIDEIIRVKTPNGDAFYRYNHDGYGEMDDGRRWNWDGKYTGEGRLWALLSGERGQYELARYAYERYGDVSKNGEGDRNPNTWNWKTNAQSRLGAMAKFANEGLMIPEQIWDKPEIPKNIDKQFVPELKFGEGTGSATPLAWSMAQFIRLAVNLQAGKNLDTPDIVYNRYVLEKKDGDIKLTQSEREVGTSVKIEDIKKLPSDSSNLLLNNSSLINFKKDCFGNLQVTSSTFPAVPFLLKNEKSPLILHCDNDYQVIFFEKGEGKKVEIVGDFNEWKPKNDYFVDASDNYKYQSFFFARNARVEYKLVVDGKWITDPLNPNKVDNGVGGENSFFTMPDYKPTVWDADNVITIDGATPENKFTAKPKTENLKIESKIYGEKDIQVYVPKLNETLPVLYLQDGSDYISRAKALNIAFNLVNVRKVKPFIMVFLDPKDRMKEYWANDDYAKFVAEEVVPVIDAKFKTVKSPDGRAIMGASLGGITSVHTATKYPQIFGRIGGQSVSWWIDDERVVKELETLDSSKTKLKFYLDDGTLEGVEDSRKAVKILKAKGYDVTYVEAEAGHNWTAWRDRLADAFIALWQ